MADQGLILAGDVFIGKLSSAGVFSGYEDPVNTSKLAISKPDPEKKERISNMKETLGQALGTVSQPKPSELAIAFDSLPPNILALILRGDVETVSQGSGTVTDEAVTLAPGKWMPLSKRNINSSGFSLATAAVPGTPLVEDTDYEVKRAAGLVRAIEGGAISASTACLVDFGHAAEDGTKITGDTNTIQRCRVFVDGKNLDNGKLCTLIVHDVELAPSGESDLLNGEYVTGEMTGTMKTPDGYDSPYEYTEYD